MKRYRTLILLILLTVVYLTYQSLMPKYNPEASLPPQTFSTDRALAHVKALSRAPHAVGVPAHSQVQAYLIAELEKLGLKTTIQQGYTTGNWATLSQVTNILARIEGAGNGKALLLLSHYDSAPHTSYGASDAASGVAVILEGIRAFLATNSRPENDIIILITDAEELGLNGAKYFVHHHPWAKDAGLVLNFEARGSGGPGFMLPETQGGNSRLIQEVIKAAPQYPVANSLAYSVYKTLPNDTDLTVFREDAAIPGFTFAFIDDHFDYHTALDTYERLDRNSLAHQGSYLMPLLQHFSKTRLPDFKSPEDKVYVTLPLLKLISYPFAWILPMLGIAVLIFGLLLWSGFQKKRLQPLQVLKGFLPLLIVLGINGVLGGWCWKVLPRAYPAFRDILQGFPYTGHFYIAGYALLALAVCFSVYHAFRKTTLPNLLVAPLALGLLLCGLAAAYLKGASFIIIPLMALLAAFALSLRQSQPRPIVSAGFALPALLILSPFISMFPVSLGLKLMLTATLITTLIFLWTLPFWTSFQNKNRLAGLTFLFALGFGLAAHYKADFTEERPKPSSLIYLYNANTHAALWATYDQSLIPWNKQVLGSAKRPAKPGEYPILNRKYHTPFTYVAQAPSKPIPLPQITLLQDTVSGKERILHLSITSKRPVNRLDVFTNPIPVTAASINEIPLSRDFLQNRKERLVTHVITDNAPTELRLQFPKDSVMELTLYEASYDLLTHTAFAVPKRPGNSVPMPFVLNDAVVVTQTLRFD